ncbi:MAG TPA: DNA polymerase III subunit delta' [Pyrinomonadaceae bacterium]|nr:DNA polymerase III subunit delta' [Pyrinomonadaceae bacterium]
MKDLVGNKPVKEILQRLIATGRVPNALLFTGPEGVGKKQFALELARGLVCTDRGDHAACGHCAACSRVGEFSIPNFEKADETKHVFFSQHPDVGMVVPFRRNLNVDAIRALEREAHFRPYEAEARVFIVEDADKMNDAASNALLKTLEEPASTSHIILIASRADTLLPTIRSRCQTIRFAPIAFEEIESYLIRRREFLPDDAALAARVSGGSLSRAAGMVPASFRTQRSAMLAVLRAAVGDNKRELLAASEEMADAKVKEEYEEKLGILEGLIHDAWLLRNGAGEAEILNIDIKPDLSRIAESADSPTLSRWLNEIEAMYENFIVNINRKVATDSLFVSMAG